MISFFWFGALKAQNAAEVFANEENISHEIWLSGFLQDSSKFSFFNYTRFKVDYNDSKSNQFLSYSTLNYELGKGFGIASGGYITNQGFAPVVALSYFYQDDTWQFNVFPSYVFGNNETIEIFLFAQYRSKLTNKFRLFSQLIINTNFTFDQHNFSEQNLRIGLDYRSFKFGIGADLTQVPTFENEGFHSQKTVLNHNIGLFIRKEF